MIRMWIFLLVFFSTPAAWATTYWASTTGGSTTCTAIDGDTDPGVYGLPAFAIGCMGASDTTLLKNGIYTTSIDFNAIPDGTAGAPSIIRCETDEGCTLQYDIASPGTFGVVTIGYPTMQEYVRVGGETGGFLVDGVSCSLSKCKGIFVYANNASSNPRGIEIIGNRVRNHHSDGIQYARNSATNAAPVDIVVKDNTVEQAAAPICCSGNPPHGIYIKTHGGVISHNDVTAPGDNTFGNSFAIQCYLPCNNATIKRNILRSPGPSLGVVVSQGNGNVVSRNVIKKTSGTSTICISLGSAVGTIPNKAFHNVCDGFTTFLSNAVNTVALNEARNNVCVTGTSCTITDSKGDLIQSGNVTGVATSAFTNTATLDYTLVSGSVLIDAGTAISGEPYHGSNPDRGPFETPVFAACEVPSAATSTIVATFTNDVSPPMLPATGATTFTARRNGSNNALTGSVTRVADGQFSLPLTTAYVGGDTADISGSVWTITDSSRLGGSLNQKYLGTLTNQSCTNNAGGATYTFTQSAYEIRDWLGTESAPTILPYGFVSTGAAENYIGYKVRKGGKFRLRLSVVCGVANCPPTAFALYRSTGGAYSALTDSFGVSGGFKFCGEVNPSVSNGGSTTSQLSTSGTFVPGGIMYTAAAVPTISGLNTGFKTELEYCIDVRDTASSGNVSFRLYEQNGTPLTTYTVTPTLAIEDSAAGSQ